MASTSTETAGAPWCVGVIGGKGHLGARVVRALGESAGVHAVALSRSTLPGFDLNCAADHEQLQHFSTIIDVGEGRDRAPDQAIEYCLNHGQVFVECSSSAPVIERLHRRFRDHLGPGSLVLGAGIFTGLSNLLVAHLARAVGTPLGAHLVIGSSPFSGAGASTCDLMVDMMRVSSVRFEAGRRLESPGIDIVPRTPMSDGRLETGLRASFAESYMLQASLDLQDCSVLFRPKPSWLIAALAAIPKSLAARRSFAWCLGLYFRALRGVILRSRATPVELHARVVSAQTAVCGRLTCDDGMYVAGQAIAAIAAASREVGPGCHWVDKVVVLPEILARLAGRGVEVQFNSGPFAQADRAAADATV